MGPTGEGPQGWGRPLYAGVLNALVVGPGSSLLDLGCGVGLFARAAADRGALVTGVDADPDAVARAAAAVPEGTFRVGDVQRRVVPPGSVDAVATVQVLTHVADPVAVLREARRAVRPGGRVAATVWGRPGECDVRLFGEALARWVPPPPQPGHPLTSPARLQAVARRAGLEVTAVDAVVCAFEYPDPEALLGPLLASGLGRAAVARGGRAAVRRAVSDALEARRTDAGGYRLDNVIRVLVARPEEAAADG